MEAEQDKQRRSGTRVVTVAKLADLQEGQCRSVDVGGWYIAIYNAGGTVYATDNTCPHAGGSLGEGLLTGELIRCPWHGWKFNVKTGERPENRSFAVPCFPVDVVEGDIRVTLPLEPPA